MKLIYFHSEEELIQGCLRQDRRAQKALYDRYSGKFLALCMRYFPSKLQSEERLLEAFLKIYQNLHKFKGKGSFEGWMRRIVNTTCIDELRRNSRLVYIEEQNMNLEHAESEEFDQENEIPISVVNEAVSKLPVGYKTVFSLYIIEEYSHNEIAQMLGISLSTSKTQLFRAKKMLMEELRKNRVYGS